MKKRHKKLIRRYLNEAGVELEPWQVAIINRLAADVARAAHQPAAGLDHGMTLTLTEIRALPEAKR